GAGRARALALALIRLEKGTYGICIRCGGQIARERLELLPEIETCRDCTDICPVGPRGDGGRCNGCGAPRRSSGGCPVAHSPASGYVARTGTATVKSHA